jgi:SPP1 family predicted phage head-tail adaptor
MSACKSAPLLDQRVTLQAKSVTRAANGEEVVTWGDVATVWAEAIPLRGREFYAAAQMQQAIDVRFRIRERAGLTGDMRLLWKAQPYDIIAIIPGTAQFAGFLELMAVSGVRNGG